MEMTVVSSKFQVVIPKSVRERVGISKGQRVVFEPMENELRLVVVPSLAQLEGKFPQLRHAPSRQELWGD